MGRKQPSIRRRVKKLEEMAGTPLFKRGAQGVILTRPGNELLKSARRILDLLHKTEKMLGAPPTTGRIRIGIPEECGASDLWHALRAFGDLCPDVETTVQFAMTGALQQALDQGDLDLALMISQEKKPSEEIMLADPLVWSTSMLHNAHRQPPVPVCDL
ncbi:LysR family transcriptional regulator [Mesorhizobium sp. M0134]|uniref:LysR family transcriptional regulator n=1 Tax=Mesorhizobium sp. M0134 TaxID=2956889 RepID=UPI00333CDF27